MEQQTITVEKLFETIGRQAMLITALQEEVARLRAVQPMPAAADVSVAANGRGR